MHLNQMLSIGSQDRRCTDTIVMHHNMSNADVFEIG